MRSQVFAVRKNPKLQENVNITNGADLKKLLRMQQLFQIMKQELTEKWLNGCQKASVS